MRRWWALGLGGCAIAAACSAFRADVAPGADGGTDSGAMPGSDAGGTADTATAPPVDAGADGPAIVSLAATEPPCPVPLGVVDVQHAVTHILAAPLAIEHEYPFQIATDVDYVYWAAQSASASDTDVTAPYNGHATARVHRVSKKGATLADTLADGQPGTTSIAVDGDFVYWATTSSGTTGLRRARRDCVSSCAVTEVYQGALGTIERILVPAPGILILVTDQGGYYRYAVGAETPPTIVGQTGKYPSFAVINDVVFSGNALAADVFRAQDLAANPGSSSFATMPAAAQGAIFLATDCTSLWAYGQDLRIWKTPTTPGSPFSAFVDAGLAETSDMGSDLRYLYVAVENDGGGLFAFDKTTRAVSKVYGGNVWALAVDADGVYWGEHGRTNGGAMHALVNPD